MLLAGAAVGLVALFAEPTLAQQYTPREYGTFPLIGSRAFINSSRVYLPAQRIAETVIA